MLARRDLELPEDLGTGGFVLGLDRLDEAHMRP